MPHNDFSCFGLSSARFATDEDGLVDVVFSHMVEGFHGNSVDVGWLAVAISVGIHVHEVWSIQVEPSVWIYSDTNIAGIRIREFAKESMSEVIKYGSFMQIVEFDHIIESISLIR